MVHNSLVSIQRIRDDPHDQDEVPHNPLDEQLGTPMTDARRLEIYTGCMKKATELLNKTAPPPKA